MPKTTLPLRDDQGNLDRPTSLSGCRFPRTVARVSWDAGLQRWITTVGGQVVGTGTTRKDQVDSARIALRTLWTEHGIPGQLWVQNRKTGWFSKAAEATYGLDPRGSKG
jgi:hypothetical protein